MRSAIYTQRKGSDAKRWYSTFLRPLYEQHTKTEANDEKIAAIEVVEWPTSVVKEVVKYEFENLTSFISNT